MTDPYVWMKNPALPDNEPVQVPRQAFEAVYEPRGWEQVEETAEPSQEDLNATVRPPAEQEPDETAPGDKPAESYKPAAGGRSAARGKAGPSKGKE